MSERSEYFPALKPLTGPHRIEWFGQVYRGTSTSVALVFSPWGVDRNTGELKSSATEHSTILMPVPYLRMFRIGDIWEGGRFTGQRDIRSRETFHLDIQEGTVKVLPAGAPLDGCSTVPEYPLPFLLIGAHRENTHAYCARIQISEDTMLIIPCMELVRFYFGASGSFLKRLFSGAFALDKLFSRKRRGANSGAVNVDLAEDLPGAAATTVARIAFDTQARSAAAWIVNSSIAAAANKSRYYPKTTFPFFGETDLTVEGRWVEQNGRRIFLAEQIKRCTHPFPFETLFYTTRKSVLVRKGAEAPFCAGNSDEVESSPGKVEHQFEEGYVSSILQPVGIPFELEIDEPFPDLAAKKVRRVKPESRGGAYGSRTDVSGELATGVEVSSSETRSAEVMAEVEDSTFDEASIEELPTKAVQMFKEAFGVHNTGSNGRFRLRPPIFIEHTDPMRPGPFIRGSDVCPGRDRQLDQIWCAVIDAKDNSVGITLVLVRDGDHSPSNDHVLLIGVDLNNEVSATIQRYCMEFAQHRLSDQLMDHILVSIPTRQATKLFSTIREMSHGIEWMGQINRYQVNPLLSWSLMPKGLLEQPLLSEEKLDQLLKGAYEESQTKPYEGFAQGVLKASDIY